MKRGIFVLFFLIVAFLMFYSGTWNAKGQQGERYCFNAGNFGFVGANEGQKDIPIDYSYENLETIGWKIRTSEGNYGIIANELDSDKEQIELPISVIRATESRTNCEYYYFSFQRQAKTLNYELPRKNAEPSVVVGKQICEYSIEPITQDLNQILALGGRALEISGVCPDAREKELGEGVTECPETQTCEVVITAGPKENFGFGVQKDSCRNKIIEVDNNGLEIAQGELDSRAENFVRECESGAKAPARMQVKVNPEPETGGSSGGNQGGTSGESGSVIGCDGPAIGCDDPFTPECKNNKDDDGDHFLDCKGSNADSGCFVCDWATNTIRCEPEDNSEKTCPLSGSPEKTLRCGEQCCNPETEMCVGGNVMEIDGKLVPVSLICSVGCQPLSCADASNPERCKEIVQECAAENGFSGFVDKQGRIKLPGFKMRVTKTTDIDSCDPTSTLDAGSIIEITYNRWINLDCKNPGLIGKATIDFVYLNTFWFFGNNPSLDEVRKKLFESIESGVKDFLSAEDIEEIRQLIYSQFYPPEDQKEGQNKIITIEIINGRYIITINGITKSFEIKNSNVLLTNPPSLEKIKDITNAKGEEKIRSIRIEIFDENGNKIRDSCFNNLKIGDNANRDGVLRLIDELYNLNIKSYFDKLKALLDCVKEKSCAKP